ncbi:metal resistance protein ycf1 [Phaffia rhodozyma]|uniref:Metal resistance protein ycf1 n=1 Tax=Phaffia rhodozyma TaxID=264483 RepID=A0A0F7SQ09_PHARH|nr:metal resistance protein ycf1 [Phaffia rhodozyma]
MSDPSFQSWIDPLFNIHPFIPSYLNLSSSLAASIDSSSVHRLVTRSHQHAKPDGFCPSSEGWGPFSSLRQADLTPCAEEALRAGLCTIAGLTAVGLTLRLLKTQTAKKRVGRSRRVLYAKTALLSITTILALLHLIGIIFTSAVPFLSIFTLSSATLFLFSLASIPLTYVNHSRTRQSSTLLLVFWPIFLAASALTIRTWYLQGFLFHPSTALVWAPFFGFIGVGLLAFSLECLCPEKSGGVKLPEGEDGQDGGTSDWKENPKLTANFFEILTFSWLTPLMKLGSQRFIDEDDIFDLDPNDKADVLGEKLYKNWEAARVKHHAQHPVKQVEGQKAKHPSLFVVLAKSYGGPYLTATVLKILNDLLSFTQPQLLRLLLRYVATYQTSTPAPAIQGIAISLTMFLAAVIQTCLLHQYFDRAFTTGMRVKTGIVWLIYRKALVLSNGEKVGRAGGDIVNLQSVDAMRLADLMQYGQMVFSGPLQIILAFVSLYNLLGWSAFCGVAVMVVSLPLNAMIARYQKKLQVKQMKIKDKRTRLMNELLSNIKSIKLYAWEKSFSEKVLDVRNNLELVMIRRIGIVNAFSNFFWASTPFLVAFATFSSYSLTSKKPLTSDVIFPAISLFGLLQFPLAMLSMIISSIIEALVSESRLVDFLDAEELQKDSRTVLLPKSPSEYQKGDSLVEITNGTFTWNKNAESSTLKKVDFVARKGELVAVLGRVGDGKSSLLSAALGEMTRREGQVTVRGSIAYFSQQSWVLSATVKDNILFGHAYDPKFYQLVLDACALPPDLAILPLGDQTEVGEKGVSLSGGQKARIALARAVYARADIYLLDDPLCAVDNHVAAHLFEHVLGPKGLLKDRARVLCTNSVAFLAKTDRLLMLRGGEVLEQDTYDQVMEERNSALFNLINTLGKQSAPNSAPGTPKADSSDGSTMVDTESLTDKLETKMSLNDDNAVLLSAKESKTQAIRRMKDSTKPKEAMERGQVSSSVYKGYISSASFVGVCAFLFATFAAQGSQIASNLILRNWGEANLVEHRTTSIGLYLFFYGLAGASASVLNMISSLLLWTFCAVRCSKKLHDDAFRALMRSPMSFFERTPQGRILNVFSRDIYVIDEVLIRTFSGFFRTLASVGGVLFVIGLGAPSILIGVIPIFFIYRKIMRYYLASSRELKRLDSTSRAPIFSWFGETLSGLSSIRAYSQTARFSAHNEAFLDRNNACYLPSVSVNRWLAVRLEFLGSLIMLAAALVSVVALIVSRNVDAGLVGLMMSYAVSVTGSLNWVVRSASEVETNIVSVERVMINYTRLDAEAPDEISETTPRESWPEEGAIEFNNYTTRYRPDLPACVSDVSISIKPAEKIGVCGRTGAGKSSLTLALFRVIEATAGSIFIDGVDIGTIGLHDLRSKISIIPQDPQLFEGTLRENIDPIGQYTDTLIWEALSHAHLKVYAEANGGLDGTVTEGGGNLSSGQKQLICFARALLRKSRILVLDEATSAIDLETDAAVQEILRGPDFAATTTITIAHRLDTIMHSTRVLVMDKGQVAEFDTPENLLSKKDSIFYSLASQAGLINADISI